MGIFNFLTNKNKSFDVPPVIPLVSQYKPMEPEIPENVFVHNEAVIDPTPVVSEALPIDSNINLLFNFLDRNHEAKGYDDALINSDSSHLIQNLEALKNELVRTINKVKTFYEDFIKEIDYHIISRGRSGMIDIVEELEMKKQIAQNHMEKIQGIEDDTHNDTGDCKGILISYTRGFKNGLAAISHHAILKRRF